MHNIDVVQRIMDYFLMHEQQQQQKQQNIGKTNVSKILDNYLAEVARDPNLSITKFQVLAESLPENARTCHDGLYRAIDTYLKVTYQFFTLFHYFEGKEKQIFQNINSLLSFSVTSVTIWTWSEKAVQINELWEIVTWCMHPCRTKWPITS